MAVVAHEEQEGSEEKRITDGRTRRRDANGVDSDQIKRCGMWLPSKRRFCASHVHSTSLYCGNHDPSARKNRVPCPVDPSHTVLQEEVALHVKKCQATKHLKFSEEQAYYRKGVNAGSDVEEEFVRPVAIEKDHEVKQHSSSPIPEFTVESGRTNELSPKDCPSGTGCSASSKVSVKKDQGVEFHSSAGKRAAITALAEAEFLDLVRRIESSYEACTRDETIEESFLQPAQCLKWWDRNRDRRLPFQEKHVSQQASMLGNIEAFGLLEGNNDEVSKSQGNGDARAYVEFGAGRGYLSQMLCDSYGVSSVVLVERKAYKYKADRTLRQLTGVSVERLRTDIEDLYIDGVQSLRGQRYVAASKHLCGPATDMTLRCCLKEIAGSSDKLSDQQEESSSPALEGIGIATCCHHLCQWRSYVNKKFFIELGFSELEFHMITWLTSWAVSESGEHAEAQHSGFCASGLEMLREQTPVSDGTFLYPVNAKPRLSLEMDAMDVSARGELGRKCKHLIDFGRLLYLRRHGMEGKIVKYISSSVSPENKLLLAKKKSNRLA